MSSSNSNEDYSNLNERSHDQLETALKDLDPNDPNEATAYWQAKYYHDNWNALHPNDPIHHDQGGAGQGTGVGTGTVDGAGGTGNGEIWQLAPLSNQDIDVFFSWVKNSNLSPEQKHEKIEDMEDKYGGVLTAEQKGKVHFYDPTFDPDGRWSVLTRQSGHANSLDGWNLAVNLDDSWKTVGPPPANHDQVHSLFNQAMNVYISNIEKWVDQGIVDIKIDSNQAFNILQNFVKQLEPEYIGDDHPRLQEFLSWVHNYDSKLAELNGKIHPGEVYNNQVTVPHWNRDGGDFLSNVFNAASTLVTNVSNSLGLEHATNIIIHKVEENPLKALALAVAAVNGVPLEPLLQAAGAGAGASFGVSLANGDDFGIALEKALDGGYQGAGSYALYGPPSPNTAHLSPHMAGQLVTKVGEKMAQGEKFEDAIQDAAKDLAITDVSQYLGGKIATGASSVLGVDANGFTVQTASHAAGSATVAAVTGGDATAAAVGSIGGSLGGLAAETAMSTTPGTNDSGGVIVVDNIAAAPAPGDNGIPYCARLGRQTQPPLDQDLYTQTLRDLNGKPIEDFWAPVQAIKNSEAVIPWGIVPKENSLAPHATAYQYGSQIFFNEDPEKSPFLLKNLGVAGHENVHVDEYNQGTRITIYPNSQSELPVCSTAYNGQFVSSEPPAFVKSLEAAIAVIGYGLKNPGDPEIQKYMPQIIEKTAATLEVERGMMSVETAAYEQLNRALQAGHLPKLIIDSKQDLCQVTVDVTLPGVEPGSPSQIQKIDLVFPTSSKDPAVVYQEIQKTLTANIQSIAGIPDRLADMAKQFAVYDKIYTQTQSQTDNSTFLSNLYQTTLGRAPDDGGFNHYLNELNVGNLNRTQVVSLFANSGEAKNRNR